MLETRLALFTALLHDPLFGCFFIGRARSNANKRNDSAALKHSPKKDESYRFNESSSYPANLAASNDEPEFCSFLSNVRQRTVGNDKKREKEEEDRG